MLTRVSCDQCGFICLWTDDPEGFLRSSCRNPSRCEAKYRARSGAERTDVAERRARSTDDGMHARPR
jgi:hypothetical protein